MAGLMKFTIKEPTEDPNFLDKTRKIPTKGILKYDIKWDQKLLFVWYDISNQEILDDIMYFIKKNRKTEFLFSVTEQTYDLFLQMYGILHQAHFTNDKNTILLTFHGILGRDDIN
jgi:hypothetical protein